MLHVEGLAKRYGTGPSSVEAIRQLDFRISASELVCVVGASGAGKSTLLRCLAGLLQPTEGRVILDGAVIDGPPEHVALVFQDYSRSLMPWMSLRHNVELPLRNKVDGREARRTRAMTSLEAVGLSGFEDMYPWQLSGGMQQRVAIARGLAYEPRVLLMDEPFASVDAQTRSDLEDLLLRVRADLDLTIVFVTHDIDEAVYLGDRVLALGPRPTTLLDDIPVGLPTPRDQIATKELPEFSRLRSRVMQLVRSGAGDVISAELAPQHSR